MEICGGNGVIPINAVFKGFPLRYTADSRKDLAAFVSGTQNDGTLKIT